MRRAFKASAVSLFFFDAAIPKSLQITAAAFRVDGADADVVLINPVRRSPRLVLLHLAFAVVSFVFILVGKITLLVDPFPRSPLALLRPSSAGLKEAWRGHNLLWRWLCPWILKGDIS